MKRFQLSFLVAALAVAVSAPAQRDVVRTERNVRGGIVSSRPNVGDHIAGTRQPVQPKVAAERGGRNGRSERGESRGRGARSVATVRPVVRPPQSVGRGQVRGHTHAHGHVHVQPRGYWTTVCEPVLVQAGYWQIVCVPAVYGWIVDPCGSRRWGIVKPACDERVWVEPVYENRHRRVWVSP
ncbi:MAG: hypothetical protein KDE27_13795 [Planctomycetes bacterium]|nr:hypothetical protein [Planctomycetota bacterium]